MTRYDDEEKGIQGLVNRLHDHKENGTEKNRQAVGIQRKWILLSSERQSSVNFLFGLAVESLFTVGSKDGQEMSPENECLSNGKSSSFEDNRFLNPKSSYERILTAPPCRLIHDYSSRHRQR